MGLFHSIMALIIVGDLCFKVEFPVEGSETMKKIVIQLLSDSLGVSRVTVWKVLNGRPGVAPETAARIRKAVERLQKENEEEGDGDNELLFQQNIKNITLLASRTDSSSFWRRIVDQIAAQLNQRMITMQYVPIDVMNLTPDDISALAQPEKTDGIIIVNVYDPSIFTVLSAVSTPKIYLDTVPGRTATDLRGDLFLLEGRQTVAAITEDLIEKGCRQIGFIGDIHYALTNRLRLDGFLEAMKRNKLPVENSLCLTKPLGSNSYSDDIGAFIDGIKTLPDAFVCASDYAAFITLNQLQERGYKIPDDILLSGYDDTSEFLLERFKISSVHVQNGLLGKRMITQLLYRIENPQADYEEILIYPKILYRK